MNLAIFDIDGTLTRTSRVDDMCYQDALEETLGITNASTDWGAYRESTDQGILTELIERHCARAIVDDDIECMRACFVRRLGEARERDPSLFVPIPGAIEVCRYLEEKTSWCIALATGGWMASARLKLKWSGFAIDHVPAAFSDDALSRVEIVQTAHERARECHGEEFDRIVLLGDAEWDIRAARDLDWPFIGISHEKGEPYLRGHGARSVLTDYESRDQVRQMLQEALSPGQALAVKPSLPETLQ